MTPHRSSGRGTFILDRMTRVGRVSLASGTTHAPTFRRLNEMITTLNEIPGGAAILRELQKPKEERTLSPLQVYEAFRVNELHKLPLGDMLKPLATALNTWLETVDCSTAQKAAHKTMINKVTERGAGTVADLPGRLVLVGLDCRKEKTPAQFNRVRSSALAFIRDTVKRSHRLYGEVRDIPPMKEKKAPRKNPQSVTQLTVLAEKLTDRRDKAALWAMAMTGMGPKEHYVDGFTVMGDRVVIHGVKREKRQRIVPHLRTHLYQVALPESDVGVAREQRRFGERLSEASGGAVHTYDLRRSYANFMEAAGIPRTRRRLYMGHAKQDVTDIYEEHEVRAFLVEDTEKLERHLSATERKGFEVVKGGKS